MSGYIAGIARGHNSAVCLLKDGEIIFSIEEERLSRLKYDGGPYAAFQKILEYTDTIDYLAISHTQPDTNLVEYSGDDIFTGMARKFGLIKSPNQVVHMHDQHHKSHASIAFYRSGFDVAISVIVDGAGTYVPAPKSNTFWEVESVFKCNYPNSFEEVYKHLASKNPMKTTNNEIARIDDNPGIVKAYEAVTEYCGFSSIEAGKTMGLFPYGKENNKIPKIINKGLQKYPTVDKNVIIPNYPNGSVVNDELFDSLTELNEDKKLYELQTRKDMAYRIQKDSQQAVLDLIIDGVNKTGIKNVVVSGGYGLNCVANYFYLDKLKELGINLYVEPISNDSGTAIGAALIQHYEVTKDTKVRKRDENLYLGPKYNLAENKILKQGNDVEYIDIIKLLREKNIVAMFQGRSENGPRALGNRSILFDPTFKDGKDFVNKIKHREFFRPFAASVLESEANNWFDLKGMKSSPSMMYAVNVLEERLETIPSVTHVDGTCRIQTVNEKQNFHYWNLIQEFNRQTGVPLLFNTSFNLGGEPLVETFNDALNTLKKSDIEYLYLPEYKKLIFIPNIL